MRRENELPLEHQQSRKPAIRSPGFSKQSRQNNQAEKNGFATPPPMNGRLFSAFVGTEVLSLLLRNDKRRGMFIQNLSANTLYVGIATPPALSGATYLNAIEIPSNNSLELKGEMCPIDDIYGLSDGDSQVVVLETSV